MENLQLSFQVVFPLLMLMAVGYLLRPLLRLGEGNWLEISNKLIFQLLLPASLFRSMARSDLSTAFNGDTLLVVCVCVGGLLVTFFALWLIVPRLEPENPRRGVLIQGMYRANTAIFGLPVAISLYGQDNVTVVVLLLAIVVPLLNVLSVVILEYYRGGKPSWLAILKKIAKNPLIIGIALGVVCSLLHVQLPSVVQDTLWGMADCATPLAFLTLGASFTFASAAQNRKALTATVLCKLLLIPGIWLTLGILLGFRQQNMLAVLTTFAPPTAVTSFPMACAMGGDSQLSNEIVVFTSIFSIFSMFLWLFVLKSLAFV